MFIVYWLLIIWVIITVAAIAWTFINNYKLNSVSRRTLEQLQVEETRLKIQKLRLELKEKEQNKDLH